ncbi:MAG: helix-turn-helix domain-containing protein [Bacteroidota bacterium]
MEKFLFMQEKAKILLSVPELDNKLANYSLPHGISFIREFGRQKFNKVIPGSLKNHYNKGIEICYINSGQYRWQVEKKTYTLYPGDCFVTCPYEKHGGLKGHLDLGVLTWIIIETEHFGQNNILSLGQWTNLNKTEQRKIGRTLYSKSSHQFTNKNIRQITENIFHEIKHQQCYHVLKIKYLTEMLLIETCRSLEAMKKQNNDKTSEFIDKLKKYVHNHINRTITLDELSREFRLSCTALNEKVKSATGYSPINFVISVRLEKAKQLLISTNITITCIAHDCGFYSSQYFADTFKKWNGMSPGRFRKNY